MFYDVIRVLHDTVKQLKLRDPFEGLTLMAKLVSKKKVCSIHKIISL
jgi:hypothetical protein